MVYNITMTHTYHFISGLPRSGTTLLSSILNQNPRFSADISGPLARFVRAVIEQSEAQGGYRHICPPEKRKKIIKGIFDSYYEDSPQVCFNTNRGWTSMTPLLAEIFPHGKVVVCIRDIPWVLDSFEKLITKNPLTNTNMFPGNEGTSVYSRCRSLLQEDRTLGFAYNSFKQGLFGPNRENLCVVEYDALARDPKTTMQKIYKFIGEPWFEHDFDNVEYSNDEFDADVGLKGMHTVRKKVSFEQRRPILPLDIFNEYQPLSFWKQNLAQISQGITWIR